MYKVNRWVMILSVMLIVCMLGSCGKEKDDETQVETSAETASQTEVETTVVTFPDETGFYAHGSYSNDGEDPFATAPVETTEEPDEQGTEPTEPEVTDPTEDLKTDETTSPTEPEETQPGNNSDAMTYEKYNSMSAGEQMAFFNSFESPEAFTAWYQNAKAEYESQKNSVDVNGGIADLGGFAQ